jgi:hypothetical protein
MDIKTTLRTSDDEKQRRADFVKLFENSPIPQNELLEQLGLYMRRQSLSRVLFMNDLYKQALDLHGVIMEFGVRWGQNLALFESFRGMYEPFNHNRKIIGFDTFEGFPSVHEKDGNHEIIQVGAYGVTENYEDYLSKVLDFHEKESPISQVKKYELVKGNAIEQLEKYLTNHPETIVSLAYFDFDIYEPTYKCLELLKKHLTKGSVIGFDELNDAKWPGETLAVKEVFGLDKYKIQRSPYSSAASYIVIE